MLDLLPLLSSHFVALRIFSSVLIDGRLILRQLLLITVIGWFMVLGSYNRQEIQTCGLLQPSFRLSALPELARRFDESSHASEISGSLRRYL